MTPAFRIAPAALVGATLVLAAPVAFADWPNDPSINLAVCSQPSLQLGSVLAPDGAGGAFVAWPDDRLGATRIFAQRISAGGAPLWTANGIPVTSGLTVQDGPAVIADGAGGMVVVFSEGTDIVAQRLDALGNPLWGAGGVAVCTAANMQISPAVASVGAGSFLVAWSDPRDGVYHAVYAQLLDGSGTPQWAANGESATTPVSGDQVEPVVVADGTGGGFVAWKDYSLGTAPDVFVQRFGSGGGRLAGTSGIPLCTAAGTQAGIRAVKDGLGGIVATWHDFRSGTGEIYAARVEGNLTLPWTADGVAVTSLSAGAAAPDIVSVGLGGAVIAWHDLRNFTDFDVYAQRLDLAGSAQWTANGVAVAALAGFQQVPRLVADGAGGATVFWSDTRWSVSFSAIYAQRLNAAGATQWAANGVAVTLGPWTAPSPEVVPDGTGGGIATWWDYRNGGSDIFAQHVDAWGFLGAQPEIRSVSDVPNDQGGQVKVSWDASELDSYLSGIVVAYRIFRSAPPNVAMAAVRAGAVLTPAGELRERPQRGDFVTLGTGAATTYWEFLAEVGAYRLPGYSYVAPTTGDSVGGSNPQTMFMVQAWDPVGYRAWSSDAAGGYSVDDLAPAMPAPFTGSYQSGATHLHWGANAEADLAGYRLYRGDDPGFVPGPGNLIAAQPDTGFVDPGPAGSHYKLVAVDAHGNVSPPALLTPGATVDVPAGLPAARWWLGSPRPNPARAGATIPFALARAGEVRLTVVDALGRLVRTLERGRRAAGEHVTLWDGRDGAGRPAPSGLYLVRLEASGSVLSRRLAVTR